jgi:hypothetical protein
MDTQTTLVGLGAVLAGVGSALSGWAALRAASREKVDPVHDGGLDAGGGDGSPGSGGGHGSESASPDEDHDD